MQNFFQENMNIMIWYTLMYDNIYAIKAADIQPNYAVYVSVPIYIRSFSWFLVILLGILRSFHTSDMLIRTLYALLISPPRVIPELDKSFNKNLVAEVVYILPWAGQSSDVSKTPP